MKYMFCLVSVKQLLMLTIQQITSSVSVSQRNVMASGVIPQISLIMGPCAGMTVVIMIIIVLIQCCNSVLILESFVPIKIHTCRHRGYFVFSFFFSPRASCF